MNYNDFFSLASGGKFTVFGTGFVAEMFFQGLVSHGHENNLRWFYVSREPAEKMFHGVSVYPISEYKGGEPLLIALHPANLNSIGDLKEKGICIYPFLYEYLYGKPVRQNVRIRTADILSVQPEDEYWIAARYAGIEGLLKNDAALTELYLRCISLHASEATARLRLEELRKLCEDIQIHGFNNSGSPVLIDESRRIIDGLHRTAAAAYFGVPDIYCDICTKSELFDKILTERNRLTPAALTEAGFSRDDIAVLENYRKKLSKL